MAADSTPTELPGEHTPGTAEAQAIAVRPERRTPRVVALLFVMFLLLLGAISLTGTSAPVNAAYPHSLRAVTGEGCGGG